MRILNLTKKIQKIYINSIVLCLGIIGLATFGVFADNPASGPMNSGSGSNDGSLWYENGGQTTYPGSIIIGGSVNVVGATVLSSANVVAVSPAISAINGNISSTDSLSTILSKLINVRIVQISSGSASAVATTTSNAFASTNLSASLIPKSTKNAILILVQATGDNSASGNNHYISIARNGANLGGTSGLTTQVTTAGGETQMSLDMIFLDFPNTTSALTYSAIHRNANNATGVDFGVVNIPQYMFLFEIGIGD